MQAALRQQGFVVNHKKLRRLMREHELLVIERLQGVINCCRQRASVAPSSQPPLALMRLHCMAGVTQWHDAANRPARKRGALEDPPDEGFVNNIVAELQRINRWSSYGALAAVVAALCAAVSFFSKL
jgi:hypothetical protein